MGETEAPADEETLSSKNFLHLFRAGRRRDVKIFWPKSDEQIAYAAPNEVGGVPFLLKSCYSGESVAIDMFISDGMVRAFVNLWLHKKLLLAFAYQYRMFLKFLPPKGTFFQALKSGDLL